MREKPGKRPQKPTISLRKPAISASGFLAERIIQRFPNCHLVATFANACGVIVTPDSGMRTVEDFFVGVDPDDRKAAAKAMQVCEARHGKNQCGYSTVKTRHGTAFCTGYDYSIYGQK